MTSTRVGSGRGRNGPGGLAGLQNRVGELFERSGGFDSHTLPPHRPVKPAFLILLCLAAFLATPVVAQEPLPVPAARSDSVRPLRPMSAFLMSLAIPGWAQARLDRKLTAGLFITWEGISLGMTMKTIRELKFATRTEADSARLADKRQQRQDWLILLAFNHLFAGLEAYVSSQLHDFPADVRLRAMPDRRWAATISVPW